MKICKKCGAPMAEGTTVCTNCGFNAAETVKKKKSPALIVLLLIVVVGVLAVGGFVIRNMAASLLSKSSDDGYVDVVEKLVDAVYVNHDADGLISLMPEDLVNKTIEEKFDGDKKKFAKGFESILKEIEKVSPQDVTWEISEEQVLAGAQLKRYEEVFQSENNSDRKLKAAKALAVKVSYHPQGGDGEKEETIFMVAGKIGDKWYLVDFGNN